MQIELIKTEQQYEMMIEWIDKEFDKKLMPQSEEGKKIKLALKFIKEYEDLHYPIKKNN